jgi:hypothetical protein
VQRGSEQMCALLFFTRRMDGWIIIIIIIFSLLAQASQWAARVGFSSST